MVVVVMMVVSRIRARATGRLGLPLSARVGNERALNSSFGSFGPC